MPEAFEFSSGMGAPHAGDSESPKPDIARDAQARVAQDWPVLVVSNGFQKNYERGFCNGLEDFGYKTVLVSSDDSDYRGLRPSVRWINLRGSQDATRPRWRKFADIVAYNLKLMGFVVFRRNWIVHMIGLIDPPWLCGIVEGIWFRIWARRYVMTVHNLMPHDDDSAWTERMLCWSYRLANCVIAHTPRMRQDLISRYGIAPERIVVMEHGIEPLEERNLVSTRPARSLGQPLRLLAFGKVMRYKGIDVLLEALTQVDFAFELTIAGKSYDASLTRELRRQIDIHPRAASILWANDYVPEEALARIFGCADAIVLPYRRIDQSGVLFQALRYGVPIVATRVGEFSSYVRNDVGSLCEPDDPADMARALREIATKLPSLDRRGIADFGATFEWQRTVAALRAAYDLQGPSAAQKASAK